ncbi:DUF2511 domain-containing protein [Microcoleus sp. D3_18_C4]|uniref:DUF2511 domain-containing protein n=1 Tax=Microcoleus sp. D3_18_C4 TaxID=3055335 RepID=UPI004040AFF7
MAMSLLLLATGCAEETSITVNQQTYGKTWPLTVTNGILSCVDQAVIFTAPDGNQYAVNGFAITAGYPSIDPITLPDPVNPRSKRYLGVLIDDGKRLCPQ